MTAPVHIYVQDMYIVAFFWQYLAKFIDNFFLEIAPQIISVPH